MREQGWFEQRAATKITRVATAAPSNVISESFDEAKTWEKSFVLGDDPDQAAVCIGRVTPIPMKIAPGGHPAAYSRVPKFKWEIEQKDPLGTQIMHMGAAFSDQQGRDLIDALMSLYGKQTEKLIINNPIPVEIGPPPLGSVPPQA